MLESSNVSINNTLVFAWSVRLTSFIFEKKSLLSVKQALVILSKYVLFWKHMFHLGTPVHMLVRSKSALWVLPNHLIPYNIKETGIQGLRFKKSILFPALLNFLSFFFFVKGIAWWWISWAEFCPLQNKCVEFWTSTTSKCEGIWR